MRNKPAFIALSSFALLLLIGLGYLIFAKRMVSLPHTYFKQPAAPSKAPEQPPSHIVIIVNENKTFSSIVDNPAAPFINNLMHQYATARNYHAVANPSLPNYIALTSGTTAGITTDCNPPSSTCQADVTPISSAIERSGRTWKVYAEGMPSPCTKTNSGDYVVKHNPFLYYPKVTSDQQRCEQHVVPLTDLNKDLENTASLPNYAFIIPDNCNNMHECSIEKGDTWLSQKVSAILASPAFTQRRSLLVITWDEGDQNDNHVPMIFAGSLVKRSYSSDTYYTHYSLLHTIEGLWQLTSLGEEDEKAPLMYDMFR